MKGLQATITVVGLLFLLGLSYPLMAFFSDIMEGDSGVIIRYEGSDINVDFAYRGEVELKGVELTITLMGSEELKKSARMERMVNGTHLSLRVPAEAIPSDLKEIRVKLSLSIGGVFPLTVSRTAEVTRG